MLDGDFNAAPLRQAPERDPFKVPHYERRGDVECFVRQFTKVAQVDGWPDGAGIFHLRAALRENARDCAQADTIPRIFAAPRDRFS